MSFSYNVVAFTYNVVAIATDTKYKLNIHILKNCQTVTQEKLREQKKKNYSIE